MTTYDFEQRSFAFATRVRRFIKNIPWTLGNNEDGKQVVLSSGSIAANYIEANESLSRKDFVMRIKIPKKEAKETTLWLRLLEIQTSEQDDERKALLSEAQELLLILAAILRKFS